MKVLEQIFDNGSSATTETDLASLPQSYPTANAIWFLEGGTLPAVQQALTQAGKTPGQIFVLGIDALPTTLADIKSGWVSETLAQCYFWATPFAAQLALAKIDGHGSKQQSWPIGVQAVGKAQLPYNGCPASYIPKLSK
jgi:ABC-type sugar transport system substrate-binding protein